MKLIQETIEKASFLTETTETGKKKLYIEGTFLAGDVVNKNKRMYRMDTLRNEVNRYNEEMIKTNRALGELQHNSGASINLDRASHRILSLQEDNNTFRGKALVLDTPMGMIVQKLHEGGVNLGVSSRALGSLKMHSEGYNIVQDDLRIITAADIVSDPSAPGAFVQGILENHEWILVNGVYEEKELIEDQRKIHRASRKDIEKIALEIFEEYLNRM